MPHSVPTEANPLVAGDFMSLLKISPRATRIATILGLTLAISHLAYEILEIRVTTIDDYAALRQATDPEIGNIAELYEYSIGRFYAQLKWTVIESVMSLSSDLLRTLIRVGAFLVCVGAAFGFMKRVSFQGFGPAIFAMLAISWLVVAVTYQPLFYNPLLWLGWAAIWAMGTLSWSEGNSSQRILIVSLFAVSICCHESNLSFFLWPTIILWANNHSLKEWRTWRASGLCMIVGTAYGIIGLLLRSSAAGLFETYSGGEISVAPLSALAALAKYSLGGTPGLESWLTPRWEVMEHSYWLRPTDWIDRIASNLTPTAIVSSLAVGIVLWMLTVRPVCRELIWPVFQRLLILSYVVLAPNILLALTTKYQVWAQQRMWPYYYSWMSSLALTMVAVFLFEIVWSAKLTGFQRATVRYGFIVVAILISLATNATTHESVEFLSEFRFDHSLSPPQPHELNH